MRYLLDTNICVFVIRRKSTEIVTRLEQHSAEEIGISAVTLAELRYGADKSERPAQNHAALDAFLVPLVTVDFDVDAADFYDPTLSPKWRGDIGQWTVQSGIGTDCSHSGCSRTPAASSIGQVARASSP